MTAVAAAVDVAKAAEVEAAVATAERQFGALHVVFNNAGIFPGADGSPVDTPEDVWDQVMTVNLKGVFLGCKYGIPALLRAGGGLVLLPQIFAERLGPALRVAGVLGRQVSRTLELFDAVLRFLRRAGALLALPLRLLRGTACLLRFHAPTLKLLRVLLSCDGTSASSS